MCSHDLDKTIHENSYSRNKAEWLGSNHSAVYEAIGSDKALITIRWNNKHYTKDRLSDFLYWTALTMYGL